MPEWPKSFVEALRTLPDNEIIRRVERWQRLASDMKRASSLTGRNPSVDEILNEAFASCSDEIVYNANEYTLSVIIKEAISNVITDMRKEYFFRSRDVEVTDSVLFRAQLTAGGKGRSRQKILAAEREFQEKLYQFSQSWPATKLKFNNEFSGRKQVMRDNISPILLKLTENPVRYISVTENSLRWYINEGLLCEDLNLERKVFNSRMKRFKDFLKEIEVPFEVLLTGLVMADMGSAIRIAGENHDHI